MPQSTSFFFLPVLPFFVIIFSMKSPSVSGAHLSAYCKSSTCGDFEVRYPFWLLDSAPNSSRYCGYPGFGIDCSSSIGYPIIHLQSGDFYVKAIDYENHTLLLVDIDATTNPTCPRPRRNLTVDDQRLYHSSRDLNLTFYFNCSSRLPLTHSIDCLRSGGNVSYVSLAEPEDQEFAWFGICEEKVLEPVTAMDVRRTKNWGSGFGGAINYGFVLDWRSSMDCAKCEISKGHCGYSNVTDKFLCFCTDGSITNNYCKGGLNVGRRIGIVFGSVVGGAIFMCLVFFCYQRNKTRHLSASKLVSRDISYPLSVSDPEKGGSYLGVHVFTYDELEEATKNFNSNKVLGDGGFGTVYKGNLAVFKVRCLCPQRGA